jgi:hypothetical protein
MAINVDTVYKTVLLILNQQQRGYMTPDEFNKVGTQVQRNIFENYDDDLNQQYRLPQNDTEYANRVMNLEEKLDIFKRFGTATPTASGSNIYTLPTTATTPTITQSFTQANPSLGNQVFTVTNWTAAESQNAIVKVYLQGALQTSPAQYTWDAGTVTITFAAAPTAADVILIELYPEDFYRLGTVIYNDITEVQVIERNELYLLERSPLTKASTIQPYCLYENKQLTIYPTTITATTIADSLITASYLKRPSNVIWGYSTGGIGQFLYSPNASVDFDLHTSEQTEVILRILVYAGVIIEDPNIIQIAAGQVQAEEQNSKI